MYKNVGNITILHNDDEVPNALVVMNKWPNWYVYSIAISHMASNQCNLLSYSSYDGPENFFVNNGTRLSISHAGHTV